jgi:hypothetical protein
LIWRPRRGNHGGVSSGEARLPSAFREVYGAIRGISAGDRAVRKRSSRVLGLAALVAALSFGADAHAARVTLGQFDGPRSQQLKWRVSGALKRGGHDVVLLRAPKPSAPKSRFRSIAEKYQLDAFITASASASRDDSWTLTLSLRGANGEELSQTITLRGSSLSDLVEEIRGNAAGRLDEVLGGGSGSVDGDQPRRIAGARGRAGDDEEEAPRAAGKGRRVSAAAGGVVDLDADEEGSARPASKKGGSKGLSAKRPSKAADSEASEEWNADGDSAGSTDESSSEASSGEPEASESSTPEDEGSSEDDSAGDAAKMPWVKLGVRAGFVSRSLSYEQDIYQRLRSQDTGAGVYRLDAAAYVFARSVRQYFALIGSYEGAMFGDVQDADLDTSFGVRYSELQGGLRARYPIGNNEIGAQLTFGSMLAGLDDNDQAGVPDYNYTFARVAADGTWRFGKLGATALLGLRLPTGYGEVGTEQWFPRVGGYGIEGSLGLEYRISDMISVDASGSLRRYVLDMDSRPQDAQLGVSEVAAGAVDLYLSGYVGVTFSL